MERRLILLRHAKSSWKSDATTDHERPLNGRGKRSASLVGEELVRLGWCPDAVHSSDSVRTRQTWRRMEPVFGETSIDVSFWPDLYEGDLDDIVGLADGWNPTSETVMLIGHNPGWEETLYRLTGVAERMTTCNAALLRGRGDTWNDALAGRWNLERIIRPRELELGLD